MPDRLVQVFTGGGGTIGDSGARVRVLWRYADAT